MSDRGLLVRQRGAHELGTSLVASAHRVEVPPCFSETQPAVGAASNSVRIVVVLLIVLLEAHWTDLEAGALAERQEAAASHAFGNHRSGGQAVRLNCGGTGLPCIYVGIGNLALPVGDRSIWCSSGADR